MTDLEIQKIVTEMEKMNEETKLTRKKSRWFEVTLLLAAFAAGGVWVKFIFN